MHGQSAADLLKSAEIALKHAKAEGHGTRSLFRPEMDTELKTRRALEALIRKAVASGSFELHYQPIVNAADRRLAGFEALLRLPDGAGRLVPPATFIPLAESLGLITEIGGWVIRRACMDAADWPSKLVIAVNLSPAQFEAGDLVPTVREALAVSGLPARRLELEITEGFLLSRSESVLAQLAELKALGVQIAMDDFGTGYSSLSYLWKFPFDKLKIDQSFARALGTDEHLPSVLEAIVALGRKLGMRVTAEGVETGPQADFLAGIGCDQLQGYYLSRPLPGARLPALILQDFRAATPKEEAAVARLQA
jgi:EAL domain-containing protein (putative c-di-GMP-specific phosphodiesterase class I)